MKTVSAVLIVALAAACETTARDRGSDSASDNRVHTASGLIYETMKPGTGRSARRGDTVRIHETLSLADGRVIFNSREKGTPVTFVLGANQVIPGVEEGVTGMRVGERRSLVVPPSLDGRTYDPAFIPAGSTLYYDIELVTIVK
jgi:peptidylprolyl isomerase